MRVSRLQSCGATGNAILKFRHTTPIRHAIVAIHQDATEKPKPFKEIPGPSSLPFIGPFLHFLPGIGSLGGQMGYEMNENLYKTYGPIVKLDGMMGKPTMVMLYDSEACAEVLRGENITAVRPGFQSLEYYRKEYKKKPDPNAITGLITDHGAPWKEMRMKVNPVMLQPKTVKLYSTVLDQVAVDMVERIKSLRDNKNMIPDRFDIEMNKWALESIGIVALGGRIGALEPDLPDDSATRQLIQCVHDIFEVAQNLDFKPSIWRYFPTKEFKRGMKLYEHQITLSKIFIQKARKELELKKKSEPTEENSILEKLLEIDEHIAVVMAADMLFAGVDTAANTVMAVLYLLAKNPEKQDKLREEVLADSEKKYLKACIKESMRIMPVVSGNLRQATKDYQLCGYKIPKDTHIVFQHQYLALMESQYPQPNEFIPERWLVPKDDPLYYGNAHPFSMMPFGFGARQCIGKRIAGLEMESFVSRLVQNFRIEWVGEPLKVKAIALNYCAPPYNYVFKDLHTTPIRHAIVAIHQDATKKPKPFKEIPGPSSLPFIGPLLHFLPGIGSLDGILGYEMNEKFYKSYGPIVKLDGMMGRPTMIMLYDPEACAEVLRGENIMAVRPGFQSLEYYRKEYNKKPDPNAITGLITDHGAPWKEMRMKVNPVMLQPKTVQLYSTVLDQVAVDMVERLKLLRDDKNMIPDRFDIEMNKWALESIGIVALGGRIGALEPDLPEDSATRQLIQCVHDIFEVAQNLDFKPSIWRYFPTKEFKRGMKLYEHQITLSKIFIQKARKELELKKKTEPTEEKSILEKLLEIDEHIAVVMAADMLFAGVDTAANTVMAVLYLLAKNSEKQDKLREEVLAGSDKKYLKACIKESMRIMPVASANLRQTTKNYQLCGYEIPKYTNIIFQHQYLALMESQYPQPNEFIPERWLVPKDDPLYYGNAHPFSMMPFGFGARQCIGKRIAGLEMESFVSRLVQNFRIEWVGEPLKVKAISLNYCAPPYNYVFKDL